MASPAAAVPSPSDAIIAERNSLLWHCISLEHEELPASFFRTNITRGSKLGEARDFLVRAGALVHLHAFHMPEGTRKEFEERHARLCVAFNADSSFDPFGTKAGKFRHECQNLWTDVIGFVSGAVCEGAVANYEASRSMERYAVPLHS